MGNNYSSSSGNLYNGNHTDTGNHTDKQQILETQINYLKHLTPYELFNIDENKSFDLKYVKKKYYEMANKAHPDKGGNEKVFNIIKSAYDYLINYLKSLESNSTHKELKSNFKDDIESDELKPTKIKDFTNDKFNKLFNEYNDKDKDRDTGYEEWLKKKNPDKNYNYNTITKFNQPQPANFNDNYSSLAQDKNINYTTNDYFDVRQAYSNPEKLNTDIKKRSMLELEKERDNTEMSEEQKNNYDKYSTYMNENDIKDRRSIYNNDIMLKRQFESINKRLLKNIY